MNRNIGPNGLLSSLAALVFGFCSRSSSAHSVVSFFTRSSLLAYSRSGSCWACPSTLHVKLNFRFLLSLWWFFTSASPTSLPHVPRSTTHLVSCSLIRLVDSSTHYALMGLFPPLWLRLPLISRFSRFDIVFNNLLICFAFTWFHLSESLSLPESVISDSSSSSALTLPSTTSGSGCALLGDPLPYVLPSSTLPLKWAMLRCCTPIMSEKFCNLSRPRGLVKISDNCR